MEEVLIQIEISKPENEAEVTKLTKNILDLKKANADLKAEQKALAKAGQENSAVYIENAKQIEINNQKIQQANSSRKNLITTLHAEDNSIKALSIRNAELRKERDLLNISTVDGRRRIAEINTEIDKNNEAIKANVSNLEKQKINVGNYKSALDGLVPGLGAFVDGVQNGTKAALAFIATPIGAVIGAIGLALSSLIAYFKGSEEGQNKLNKVVSIGSAIFEQFMNVVEDIGGALFDAFSNPKQAAIDFVAFLKDQVVNRFTGLLELIPKLGEAMNLLFAGEFAQAGKVAGDAVGKVVLGIENATDTIAGFINQTAALIDEGIKNGERLAQLNAQIDKDERALIESRAKTALEVAKLREDAITKEGEERKKTLLEAIALEEALTEKEVALSKIRLDLAKAELEANGDDKQAKKELAEATAAVFNAESTAFQNTIKFRKEIAALDEQAVAARAKLAADAIAEDKRLKEEQAAAEQQQFENNLAVLEDQYLQESLLLKQKFLNDALSKEEYEAQFTVLETSALEQRRMFFEANGLATLAIDTSLTDAKIKNKERETAAKKRLDDEQVKAQRAKDTALAQLSNSALQLFRRNTVAYQGIASAQVAVDSIKAAQAANAGMISAFPGPWGIALGLVAAAVQIALGVKNIAAINGVEFARGGVAAVGGVLRGPSHAQGGIPFSVGGRLGFEAEGGEAIINKRSTQMFKPLLSQINEAGGGVAFARGGVTRYQTGSVIASTQTRQAAANAEARMDVQRFAALVNQIQTVLVLEDFEAKKGSVDDTRNKATII